MELESTEKLLGTTRTALAVIQQALTTTETCLTDTFHSLHAALDRNTKLYRLLRVEQRKNQRYRLDKINLAIKLKESAAALTSVNKSFSLATTRYKQVIHELKKKIKALQMCYLRSGRSRTKALEKARVADQITRKKPGTLVRTGKYTADAKSMARTLHKASYSQERVGDIIQYVMQKAGFFVKNKMSRCTVQRALIEGGIAAKIQLAYKLFQADGRASTRLIPLPQHNLSINKCGPTPRDNHTLSRVENQASPSRRPSPVDGRDPSIGPTGNSHGWTGLPVPSPETAVFVTATGRDGRDEALADGTPITMPSAFLIDNGSPGATASGDATSLRGHNYEASHIMINKNGKHQNCMLGISSTVDHTSETQVQNWKSKITALSEIFNRCLLAERSAFSFEVSHFLRPLKGMNGDHASDQKKTVHLMLEWKELVT
ncbi:hypothetical protein B0H17DRAFT_1237139 [Mycena rosella]|uniref:Uncharacterized protein n=1 Tax=Mycena rosella TaxID=1033263 RepID=A0AAD7DYE1_MYCRO|nr:hypothetical protein B0H17DRAFT_1237139 [Mycena rosella]